MRESGSVILPVLQLDELKIGHNQLEVKLELRSQAVLQLAIALIISCSFLIEL